MKATDILDSFELTRRSVSPEQRDMLAKFTQFKQDAMNNLTEGIRAATGAAMGISEEKRIRAGYPDPEKDGPTAFAAKHANSAAQTKIALARYSYLKSQGYNENTIVDLAKKDALGSVFSLDQMKALINKRLDDAATQIRQQNPQITPQALQQQLRNVQRREFGI